MRAAARVVTRSERPRARNVMDDSQPAKLKVQRTMARKSLQRIAAIAIAVAWPFLGAALAMCLFGGAGVAHAQTSQVLVSNLVSNLGQTMATTSGSEHGLAQGFSTGANTAGYTLTSIEILLGIPTGPSQFPTVTLHSGSPTGSEVADFTAPSSATDPWEQRWPGR